MFSISQETITINRLIEKLPKVQQFLSSKERGTIYHNRYYKTSLAYLYQFMVTKYRRLTLETIIDSINSKTIDVYKFLDGFVTFIQTKKLSQSSINQYLVGVKSYLQFHDVDIVPYKFKKRVTVPKYEKRS